MNIHITSKLEELISEEDYSPVWINKSKQLKGSAADSRSGVGVYSNMPIFQFLVAENDNVGDIEIWALDNPDGEPIVIPKMSFRVGSIYKMYLKKFKASGITLVGYRTKNYPYDLA